VPYDDPDSTDPMTLHGVGVATNDETATVDMAQCFIEEYARMGFLPDRILRMFETPTYAGPHRAYVVLGPQRIVQLIADETALRGEPGRRHAEHPGNDRYGNVHLPVLEE